MSHSLRAAFAVLVLTAGSALADPSEAPALATDPPAETVRIVKASPLLIAHLEAQRDAIAACAPTGSAVKTRLKLAWRADGQLRRIAVAGGRAAFQRCVRRAVTGAIELPQARAGAGGATLVVHGTGPSPSVANDIHRCTQGSDCTLHFRKHACVHGDPVGVNRFNPAAVTKTYPVTRIECAMGGPQYDELRMSVAGRWSPVCEASRCQVIDHGPQQHGLQAR